MAEAVVIPARFRGPAASANGGFAAGCIASLLDGPVKVRLHKPPPLDTPLAVRQLDRGVEFVDGDDLVLSAVSTAALNASLPDVDLAAARSARARPDDLNSHPAPTCFVCGPKRPDGLRLFPGVIAEGVVATRWTPPCDLTDGDGVLPNPIVWAALDCPGGWAITATSKETDFFPALVEQSVDIVDPIRNDDDLLVIGWRTGSEGRRMSANVALIDDEGKVRAVCQQTCYAMETTWAQ